MQPGNLEFTHQHFGQTLGKGFHQLVLGLLGKGLDTRRHPGVIQCQGQVITGRSWAIIPGEAQVQAQALPDSALPVVSPDHGVDFQAFDKHSVQALFSAARQGRDAPLESGRPRPE